MMTGPVTSCVGGGGQEQAGALNVRQGDVHHALLSSINQETCTCIPYPTHPTSPVPTPRHPTLSMEKLAVGPGVDPRRVSLKYSVAHNLEAIANCLGKPVG